MIATHPLLVVLATVCSCFSDGLAKPGEQESRSASPVIWQEIRANHAKGMAFSPDGKLFAALANQQIRVWSLANKKLIHKIATPASHDALSFGPNGKTLLVADSPLKNSSLEMQSSFRRYHLETGASDKIEGKCLGGVTMIASSRNRDVLAAVASYFILGSLVSKDKAGFFAGGEILIFGQAKQKTIYCPIPELPRDRGQREQVILQCVPRYIALNKDGSKLAASADDGVLYIYDTTGAGKQVRKGGGCLRFRDDGSLECANYVYDAKGDLIEERKGPPWLALSGDFAVSREESGRLTVRNLRNRAFQVIPTSLPVQATTNPWLASLRRVDVSSDGRYVAILTNQQIVIWRVGDLD